MANLLPHQRIAPSGMFGSSVSYFKHTSIQPRQIRLLQLLSEEGISGLISGTCTQVSLDYHPFDAKPFIALSYFWGDPTPTHVILINGRPFGVTENLHSYLRRAQKRAKTDNRSL
jgi:hypothetical protein